MHHISNKNVVNVIINNSQKKKHNKSRRQYTISETPGIPFNNTVNLQNELLRQSLNPQINRSPEPSIKFRDPFENDMIAEGSPDPRVNLDNEFENTGGGYSGLYSRKDSLSDTADLKPKASYKDNREILKATYRELGGNDPIILNSTRKKTIENAIKRLRKHGNK